MAAIHTHDTALPPPCLTDNAVSFVSCGVPYLRHILLCNQWFTPFYKTFVFAFKKASFNCRFWGYAILSEGVTDLVRYCKGFFLLLLSWTAYSFFLRKHQIIDVVAPDTHFIIKEQNNRCHMAINFFLSQLSNYFWDWGWDSMKYVYTQICILLSLLFFNKCFLPRDNRSEIAILLKSDMKQLQLKDKKKQKHFI